MVRLTLSFLQTDCECGEKRELATACPTCGRKPGRHEFDYERIGRQNAAAAALRVLDQGDEPCLTVDDSLQLARDVLASFSTWLDRAFDAMEAAHEHPDRLAVAATELMSFRSRLRQAPRPRPWFNLVESLTNIADQLMATFRAYLDAFASPSVGEAQRLSGLAQIKLDALAIEVGMLADLTGTLAELDDAADPDEALLVLSRIASTKQKQMTILDVERGGAKVFDDIVESQVGCPPGVGVWFATVEAQISTTGDVERFRSVAKRVVNAVAGVDARGGELFEDDQWKSDLRDAVAGSYEFSVTTSGALAAARSDRETISQLLRTGAKLIERFCRPHLALLARVNGMEKQYPQLKAMDAADLLNKVSANRSNGDLVSGLNGKLRHADSHESFEITDHFIRTFDKRGRVTSEWRAEQLVNELLCGYESFAGLTAGIVCAAAIRRIDPLELLPDEACLPVETAIKAVAALNGWGQVEVVDDGATLTVAGAPWTSTTVRSALSITPYVPAERSTLIVLAGDPDAKRVIEIPIKEPPSIDETPGSQFSVIFLLKCRSIRVDQKPLISRAFFRMVIARAVASIVTGNPEDLLKRQTELRRLLRCSEIDGDHDLEVAIRSALKLARLQIANEKCPPADLKRIHWLVEIGEADTESPFWNETTHVQR